MLLLLVDALVAPLQGLCVRSDGGKVGMRGFALFTRPHVSQCIIMGGIFAHTSNRRVTLEARLMLSQASPKR